MNKQKDYDNRRKRLGVQSRSEFEWKWGVLRMGLPAALSLVLVRHALVGDLFTDPDWQSLAFDLLLFCGLFAPLAGIPWARAMWKRLGFDEEDQQRDESADET
jgi:hypothetical protein